MLLKSLILRINNNINTDNFKNQMIKNISLNTNNLKKGDLFISLKGKKYKKNNFIDEAILKGSPLIITDTKYKNKKKIPIIYDKEIRKKLPNLLNFFYPFNLNNLIAITGTNGKTSVSWYVHQILLLNNIKSSYFGTIGRFIENKKISDLQTTTPDICSLYRFIYEHSQKNSNNIVFEASSHGLNQKRIAGLPINIAAITNISHDHLDYHGTFKNYKKTKLKLFENYLNEDGIAIINSKLKIKNTINKKILKKSIRVITYGTPSSNIFIHKKKSTFFIKINNKNLKINIKIYNDFDLRNLECAVAITLAIGLKESLIVQSLKLINRPIGRMQECKSLYNKSKVFIDFAHTPDALKNILLSLKKIENKKSSILFGCGGNRDSSKRLEMGKIANKFADKVYITDDNPRYENPSKIREDIRLGCKRGFVIDNRYRAIKIAINNLSNNEMLVIAGKGHEKFQILKNKKNKFDDFSIANKFILKRNNEKK